MVHWTPASVPAFAPTEHDIGALLRSSTPNALSEIPYAEWYQNSLRFPDSSVSRHHRAKYGDRPYEQFARDWEAALASWDAQRWAADFVATGASHVVFVAKHSDGYALWPSEVKHPFRADWQSTRDVVGEMAEAVRAVGMRFGVYYCGGFDWSFDETPVGNMADVIASVPQGAYPEYAAAQVRELIHRYQPSVLWGDVAWPQRGPDLWRLFSEYYAVVPDGVVNDRWMPYQPRLARWAAGRGRSAIAMLARVGARRDGGLLPPKPPHFDVRTPEYLAFGTPQADAWELVRGIDRSFAYNASSDPSHLLSRRELLWSLVDARSKGGNLLLNVGPRGIDATIPNEQRLRLQWLGEWMALNGAAIRDGRPVRTRSGRRFSEMARHFATPDGMVVFDRRGDDVVGTMVS